MTNEASEAFTAQMALARGITPKKVETAYNAGAVRDFSERMKIRNADILTLARRWGIKEHKKRP